MQLLIGTCSSGTENDKHDGAKDLDASQRQYAHHKMGPHGERTRKIYQLHYAMHKPVLGSEVANR